MGCWSSPLKVFSQGLSRPSCKLSLAPGFSSHPFCLFDLPLATTICPWISEDVVGWALNLRVRMLLKGAVKVAINYVRKFHEYVNTSWQWILVFLSHSVKSFWKLKKNRVVELLKKMVVRCCNVVTFFLLTLFCLGFFFAFLSLRGGGGAQTS